MVNYRHRVGEKIVEDSQCLRGEIRRPFAALSLNPTEEGHILDLVIILIDFLVVGKHTANPACSRIRSYAVVDAVIHAHRMSHLRGQTSFQMDMPVNNREILLL